MHRADKVRQTNELISKGSMGSIITTVLTETKS